MRTPGENARKAAVREYLESVLTKSDWRTRSDLSYWLNQAWATFNPAPYTDLLERLGGTRLLDMSELRNRRDLQLKIFAKALYEGRAYLPGGTTVFASDAAMESAEYGLTELESDVVGFYARTWTSHSSGSHTGDAEALPDYVTAAFEQFKNGFPLATYELDLKLHAGGKDYDEANRLAAKRLAEMPAAEFRDHIENNPGFSGVFWRIAGDACAINVFTGEQSDACKDIIKVYVQQMWLYRDLKRAGKPTSWPKALDGLGSCVYKDVLFGDYAVPRDLFMTAEHKRRLERTRERVKRAREEHQLKERNQADSK